jgi:outer membrane protein assembly factor BamD
VTFVKLLFNGYNRYIMLKHKKSFAELGGYRMPFLSFVRGTLFSLLLLSQITPPALFAQGSSQSDLLPGQRLQVMRSRLEAMRRSLSGAMDALGPAKEKKSKDKKDETTADDPRKRLSGIDREVSSVLSEVSGFIGKQERAERYDVAELDKLEAAVNDLNPRVEAALRETASQFRQGTSTGEKAEKKESKPGFFGKILGRGGDKKYKELMEVAPGRDRQLFEEAAREVRKSGYETARLLFNVIITTYPDSIYLPLAKLAIADSFYLEGTTSSLIQAGSAYRDWLTFFPTDPLADRVMLKMAEAEMRQMGLADRDTSHARKAEQQLKVIFQQFPKTALRPDIEQRLNEVQENLGMHNLKIARFYHDRSSQGKGGLKGAQSRLREIVDKYPNFSYMDEVLYRLAATYQEEEEPDEAAKYYQQLLRDHPNSEYKEKAGEQLEVIGAVKPSPDPAKLNAPAPVRPSFKSRLFREVTGTVPVTTKKDGVLISKNDKEGDLMDLIIRNGGRIPSNIQEQKAERRPPARPLPVQTTVKPAKQSTGKQEKKQKDKPQPKAEDIGQKKPPLIPSPVSVAPSPSNSGTGTP